jgi:hypothetical protein
VNRSEQINEIGAALAKAQGAIKNPLKKNSVRTGTYSYEYADLAEVIDCCKPHLAANGLAILQSPSTDGKVVAIKTLLLHTSGQFIEDTLILMANDTRPQSIGSAITYGRRYAYCAMVGIAADVDDDGAAANGQSQGGQKEPKRAFEPKQREPQAPRQNITVPAGVAITFDAKNPTHYEKLIAKLEQMKVDGSHRLAVLEQMNGKPMTQTTLETAVKTVLEATSVVNAVRELA